MHHHDTYVYLHVRINVASATHICCLQYRFCFHVQNDDKDFGLYMLHAGAHAAKITFTNNCPYTVWPGTLTSDQKPQLSTTGFELASTASSAIDVQAPWKGRFWARTLCSTDSSGRFSCATAECSSGQVSCNGNGAVPPASLVEINIAADGGMDFYDVSY